MAQRRFGPTRGAGVVIEEQQGEQSVQPAALGFAGYAGVFEKGPVGELVVVTSPKQFFKKMGGLIPESLCPDACQAFFKRSAGAGGLCLVRITDGNEEQAEITLHQRRTDGTTAPYPVPMGKVKAKNGGRWGGALRRHTGAMANVGALTETTLTTGVTMKKDEWKGGYVELEEVANVRYPIIGNTTAGVITVASDQLMLTEHGGGAGSLRYYLVLESDGKEVSVLIGDGEDSPDTEFSLTVFVDGALVKKYGNLSTDPDSGRYWVSLINDDDGNDEIEVEDLVTGAHSAATRPANVYGVVSAVTETTLTAKIHRFTIDGAGDPTCALGTTTDDMVEQVITLTMTSATAFTAVSDKFGSLGAAGAFGTLFTPTNKWTPPFTITAGATPMVTGDTIQIIYAPLVPDQLIGGYLYPDKVNAKRSRFRITDNTHKVITVVAGSDLTADGAANDFFLVEAPTPLVEGVDGHADVTDSDYEEQAWSVDASPFNRIEGRNLGLVKFATPGVTATAVQRAGVAYAEAKNHQYRYEIPSNVVTEEGAIAYVNETLGRNDFAVSSFPSYAYVTDPGSTEGKLKLVSATGMIHGYEARCAADYDGYHKAQAGIEATLPAILKLPTGEAMLNEELLNPVGISVIKKKKGNFVIWGDRMLYVDSTWKWKHQRELMSYYEHVLQENFDYVVFALNDPLQQKPLLASLRTFFRAELVKRAIRGKDLDDAATIKIDSENNTDATAADGDLFADIALRLADTVERFRIRIGKQGIFEQVA